MAIGQRVKPDQSLSHWLEQTPLLEQRTERDKTGKGCVLFRHLLPNGLGSTQQWPSEKQARGTGKTKPPFENDRQLHQWAGPKASCPANQTQATWPRHAERSSLLAAPSCTVWRSTRSSSAAGHATLTAQALLLRAVCVLSNCQAALQPLSSYTNESTTVLGESKDVTPQYQVLLNTLTASTFLSLFQCMVATVPVL